jgi:hypothetical protein
MPVKATQGIEPTTQQLAVLKQTGDAMPLLDGLDQQLAFEIGEQYERIPEKQRGYVCLACLGWSTRQIARSFGVCQSTIQDALVKYDPGRICRSNPRTALLIRAAMALQVADRVLLSITSEDLEKASLKDKAIAYEKLQARGIELAEKAKVDNHTLKATEIEVMMAKLKTVPESKLAHSCATRKYTAPGVTGCA